MLEMWAEDRSPRGAARRHVLWLLEVQRRKVLTAPAKNPKRGRPIVRRIEIRATAEQIAKSIFANAKTPDPSKRIVKRPKV